jgi:Protein phosphatase 2C
MNKNCPLRLAFTIPKAEGQRNEDSFQCSRKGIVALSDGASVSFDSASWAQIVARQFAQNPEFSPQWLSEAIAKFCERYNRDTLPWMQQAAFDRGSFTSLLGVRFLNQGERIQVFAIGDSLAVLCDGNEIKSTFPYSAASEFDQQPQLLCTNPSENRFIDDPDFDDLRFADWSFCGLKRPALLCMTDALGRWLLSSDDQHAAIGTIRNLKTKKQFIRLVDSERAAARMKRDDTTLLAIW